MRMRSDLAADGISIPAFDGVNKVFYLEADEVEDAHYLSSIEPHYTRLKLKDNRVFYFIDADLEGDYVRDTNHLD